jgi:hypothetical protein
VSLPLFSSDHTRLIVPLSFRGPTATAFLEWITPSSLSSLQPYTSTLSVILNREGGIIDDTIVTKHADDAFYVVTNAGRRDRDLGWFREKLEEWNDSEKGRGGPVEMEILDGWGLVALQGQFLGRRSSPAHRRRLYQSRSASCVIPANSHLLRPQSTYLWKIRVRSHRRLQSSRRSWRIYRRRWLRGLSLSTLAVVWIPLFEMASRLDFDTTGANH